ncbi:MAG: hypothetical protein AABN34_00315 [Acidobacteriota bacterium]
MDGLETETARAIQIAQDRPDYWQILLAEELLRSKFSQIRERYSDLSAGKTLIASRRMPGRDYVPWLKTKLSDLVSLLRLFHEAFADFKISSGTQVEMTHPLEVKRAVEKLTALSNRLLDWEVDFRSIEPPAQFHRIRELMQGTAMECFEKIESIPDELVKPIQRSNIEGGTFTTLLTIDPPRNLHEIVNELEQLTNRVDGLIPEW